MTSPCEKVGSEGSQLTDSGNDGARSDRSANVVGTTITGSGRDGLHAARRAKITGSTLTGNGVSPDCAGNAPGADVATVRRPKLLVGSICGTSREIWTPNTWHICELD